MDMEKQEMLLREHPHLYRSGMYFECHDGWFDLIRELSVRLEAINSCRTNEGPENMLVALQVKEKFGGLRFYVSGGSDDADGLIQEAENRSTSICELCGKPGRLMSRDGWMQARCQFHLGTSVPVDQV